MDTVDRSSEKDEEPVIYVTLSDGFDVRFWLMGLSDKEYIRRAKLIREEEKKEKVYS